MGLYTDFTVRVLKCWSDDKQSKNTWKRWITGVLQYVPKVATILVVMRLNKEFTVRAPKRRSDDNTIGLAENNNSEACESICKLAIFWRWRTMIQRHMRVCLNLVIVWLVMGLSKGFTVRAPKCCSDDKHNKSSLKRWLRGRDRIWQIGHLLRRNGVDFTVRSPKFLFHDKHHKTSWTRWFGGVCQYVSNRPSSASQWG